MNTYTQRLSAFALLAAMALLLPACGSKGEVKSQKAPETVLSPESTPTEVATVTTASSDIAMPAETDKTDSAPASYVEKIKRVKGSKIITTPETTAVNTPVSTPQNTPLATPVMDATEPPPAKKSGSGWILWVLLALVGGGGGWYFWTKRQEDAAIHPPQPKPPVGGLSPVSGFTGKRDEIEAKNPSKPSIWSKKLF